jgi:hypothetical protein
VAVDQLTYTGALVVRRCWCGIRHAIPSELDTEINRNPKQSAYCPVGHSYVAATPEIEQLRADVAFWQRQAATADAEIEAEKRRSAALRGHLTRLRRRIANGVCPCCKRSFSNVRNHIRTQHGDWAAEHAEALQ